MNNVKKNMSSDILFKNRKDFLKMSYYNLEGKVFVEPEFGTWYNLGSGRKITKKPVGAPDYILNEYPRIAGTAEMINRFWEIQERVHQSYQGFTILPVKPVTPVLPPVSVSSPTTMVGRPSTTMTVQVSSPMAPTTMTGRPSTCPMNTAGTTLYYPTSTDVEDIPRDHLDQMCEFTLAGLQLKAKVLHVVDGDTLDLAFFVPMPYLNAPRQETPTRSRTFRTVRSAIGFAEDRGFFTRMRVRLAEIDTAEKKTNKGRIAKRLLENRLIRLNGIVYANFLKFEKYGRLLADIFEDEARTRNITQPLLEYRHPMLGAVAVPYHGGTKPPWPVTPPRYQPD